MTSGKLKGLSLIEVLVALAMLAIISSATIAFLPMIVGMNREANNDQDMTVRSKTFFEGLAGAATAPSDWTLNVYTSGATVAGADVTVPDECSAGLTSPTAGIVTVVLSCADTRDQILEFGSTP